MFRVLNSFTNEIEITISKNDCAILLDFARIAPCDTDTTILMCDLFHKIYNEMVQAGCDSIKYSCEV